jgi:hypothetical protein
LSAVKVEISPTLFTPIGGEYFSLDAGEAVWTDITKHVVNSSMVISESYGQNKFTIGFISVSAVNLKLDNKSGQFFSTNTIVTPFLPAGFNNSLIRITWLESNDATCGAVSCGFTKTYYEKVVFYGFIDDKYTVFDSIALTVNIKALGTIEALKKIPFYYDKALLQSLEELIYFSINTGFNTPEFAYSQIYKSILLLGKDATINNVTLNFKPFTFPVQIDETGKDFNKSVYEVLKDVSSSLYSSANYDAFSSTLSLIESPLVSKNVVGLPLFAKLRYGSTDGNENIISIKEASGGTNKIINRPKTEFVFSGEGVVNEISTGSLPVTFNEREGFIYTTGGSKFHRIIFASESTTITNIEDIQIGINENTLSYNYPKWIPNTGYVQGVSCIVEVENILYYSLTTFTSDLTFQIDLALNRWFIASPLIDSSLNLQNSIQKYGQKELDTNIEPLMLNHKGSTAIKALHLLYDLELYDTALEYKITAQLTKETLSINLLDYVRVSVATLTASGSGAIWNVSLFDDAIFADELTTLSIDVNKVWVVLARKINLIKDTITFELKQKTTV